MVVKNNDIEDNFYDFLDDESLILGEPEVDVESLPEPQPVEGFPDEEVPFEVEGPSVLDVQSMLIGKETEYTPPKEEFEVVEEQPFHINMLMRPEPTQESPVFSYNEQLPEENDVVDYDDIINKNSTVPFVQRIVDPNRFPSNYLKEDGSSSPHRTSDQDLERPLLLRHTTKKDDLYVNGVQKFIAYPTYRYDKGSKRLTEDKDPYTAVNEGNYIVFDTEEEAKDFATGWKSSATWQAGLRREEPLPELEAFVDEPIMSSPDAPMSFFDEEADLGMPVSGKSERPTTVYNGRKYFLDSGPSGNARLNLLRQVVETVNYNDNLEEEILAEAIASSIAEEALLPIETDRPNNKKYADQIKKSRDMFSALSKEDKHDFTRDYSQAYTDAFISSWQWAFSELPGTGEGFLSPESRLVSPTAEQYAEMLALDTLQGFDHDTKQKVFEHLDRYMEASEELHPSDMFLQSENVSTVGARFATQILQIPTALPTIPISAAVAIGQGNRARNRGELTSDINNANQLNAENAQLYINLQQNLHTLSAENLSSYREDIASDAIASFEMSIGASAEDLSDKPTGVFGLMASMAGRSYQPVWSRPEIGGGDPDRYNNVRMHPSDVAYILDPENLVPWQKELWEHLQKVVPERYQTTVITQSQQVAGSPFSGTETAGLPKNPSKYYSAIEIFNRNKVAAALSWADVIDPQNKDSVFLQGFRPMRPPKGGWVAQAAADSALDEMKKSLEAGKESPYNPVATPFKDEKRTFVWERSRKIDQERMKDRAAAGKFGEAYRGPAGEFLAALNSDIAVRNKYNEYDSVAREYISAMFQSFSPEVLFDEFKMTAAALPVVRAAFDEETVKKGEEYWSQYPAFASLNFAVITGAFAKLAVRPGIRTGMRAGAEAGAIAFAAPTLAESMSLLKKGDVAGAKAKFSQAIFEHNVSYLLADKRNVLAYEKSIELVNSPFQRVKTAISNLASPEKTVFLGTDEIAPTIAQKRKEASDLNAKADELDAIQDPTAASYRQRAAVADEWAETLEAQMQQEIDFRQQEKAPRRNMTETQAREKEALVAKISDDKGPKKTVSEERLKKKLTPLTNTEYTTADELLSGMRSNSDVADNYVQKLAASGETDIAVFRELLPDASATQVAELVLQGRTAKNVKNLGKVLDDIAEEGNTTPEALMAEQNRLSTAEQMALKGERRPGVYEALGLLDDQVEYFSNRGRKVKSSKPYVTAKVFGKGVEVSVKNAPYAGRFASGARGFGQVAGQGLFGERASLLWGRGSKSDKVMNRGLAVAEFLERPFSFANIPEWYGSFVNWGLHNQLSKTYQPKTFNSFLESMFMYMSTPSSMLGMDVYQSIRRAGGVEALAKGEITETLSSLKAKGDFELTQSDVQNALNDIGMFVDEFGSTADLFEGLTTLGAQEHQLMAEVIHRGLGGQKIELGGVSIDIADSIRLQVKRNGEWEDAIDHRSRMEDIKTRKKEINTQLREQLTPEDLKILASKDEKDVARANEIKQKKPLDRQIPEDQVSALKQELKNLSDDQKDIQSISTEDALSGVEGLRWAPAYDAAGNTRRYSQMSAKERELLTVANNTVAPVSTKIFNVVTDIILGQKSMDLAIQSARPRGVVAVKGPGGSYRTLKDFGNSKKGQEKASFLTKTINEVLDGGEVPKGLSAADQKFVNVAVKSLKEGEKIVTSTKAQLEGRSRVIEKRPIDFEGYEVIPKLANYVSHYFLREAEAGMAMKLIDGFKKWKKNPDDPKGISPVQFELQAEALAKKYLQLIPENKARSFVDKKLGVGKYDESPVLALETIMNASTDKLSKAGIVLQGETRFFKTQMWAKNLDFKKQIESLANYRESASMTYMGLVQKRESLRLQKVFRDNGLLLTEKELASGNFNPNAYVKGDNIPVPTLASFVTRPGTILGKGRERALKAGGAMSEFYVHKTVARHFANQHVLFKAQKNVAVRLNNLYKVGAVVNPVTGTILRNMMGMYTFQSLAADIPFRGKYVSGMHQQIQKVRRGEKVSDPAIRQMIEEGVLGNLVVELGDAGAARAASETFLVRMLSGSDGKGTAGKVLDLIDSNDASQRTVAKLADSLMGPEDAFNGLADDVSLIRASDDAYRPGQAPRMEGGIEPIRLAKRAGAHVRSAATTALKQGRALYGKVDDIGRAAYALELIKDHGYTVREAVMMANKVMFDYPDVSMITSLIRTNPYMMGMPFIGYTAWASEAMGNLITKQTPRAWMIAGAAKAHIATVEAILGTPGITQEYGLSELDPGALPLPARKVDEARGWVKKRLKGEEYYGGAEFVPGTLFSAIDTEFTSEWARAKREQEASLTPWQYVKMASSALMGHEGFGALLIPSGVKRDASNNELKDRAKAKIKLDLNNLKGDAVEAMEDLTPTQADTDSAVITKNILKNFPFFSAAVRGTIGMFSAMTGKDIGGIDVSEREAVTKFLAYSSKLYDPRFAEVLTDKGQKELRVVQALQEALFEAGEELRVQRKYGHEVTEKQEQRINDLTAAVGKRLTKMQLDREMVKKTHQFEVAKQLQKIQAALRSFVRGGDLSELDYELITGDDRFSLPKPTEAQFTSYETTQRTPIEEAPQQPSVEFGVPEDVIEDNFYDFLDDM